MSSTVEQIKEKLSIVDVVSSYIKLENAGKNSKARCPFHNEKTPSFYVSPERDTYHCFGCDRGGDIFSFVEEMEGLDFLGSLKVLAEKAGVEIQRQAKGVKEERERLFGAMDQAAFYYQKELSENQEALDYLKGRGLSIDTIKEFRIGFAPEGWRSVSVFLTEKGFTEGEMEKVGLIIRKDGRYYDRFRSRIMFPINDPSGRVVAFSGRIFLSEDAKAKDSNDVSVIAKYINSPETPLYHKSNVLYGFDKAKVAIRKEGACLLVEGQMDVVMSHQSGMGNTVASSGTALTDTQLTLLSRLTNNLILAFDADDAGVAASGRGVDLALAKDFNVRLVRLEKGTDPADLILKDKEAWRKAVGEARHVIDFYLSVLYEAGQEPDVYRKSVEKIVLPYVTHLPSKIDQAHYIAKIATALSVGEEPVWEEFRKIEGRGVEERRSSFVPQKTAAIEGAKEISPLDMRQKKIERRLLGMIIWQEGVTNPDIDLKEAHKNFEHNLGDTISKKREGMSSQDRERIIFEAEAYFNNSLDLEAEVEELFSHLSEHILRGRLTKAMDGLRSAEAGRDTVRVAEMLELCNTISREINSITARNLRG